MEEDGPDRETFGPLVDIVPESVTRLAIKIADRHLHIPISGASGKIESRKFGSYNIVYMVKVSGITRTGVKDPKLVIRIPATGWGPGMTPAAANSMESQVLTMRFIRENTSLPVPFIYEFDATQSNDIAAPYICMSYLRGQPVSDLWFSHDSTDREELRLSILTSLSKTMAQLSGLCFESMGSFATSELHQHDSPATIDTMYHWDEQSDGSIQVTASGPYQTISAYLKDQFTQATSENVWSKAEAKIVGVLLECLLVIDERSEGKFVLCYLDFDSQNVLVDA